MNISPISYRQYGRVNSFKASEVPYIKNFNLNNGGRLTYALSKKSGKFYWESFGINNNKMIVFHQDGTATLYSVPDNTKKEASKEDINRLLNLLKANNIPEPQAITQKIYK